MSDTNEDRGDELVVDTTAADAVAAAEAAKTAADAALEKEIIDGAKKEEPAAAEEKAEETKEEKEEQPRDESGKFAKAIPKARVDEMVKKEKERADTLARRLSELEAKLQTADTTKAVEDLEAKITELEKEHAKAILDGNADKMAEIAAQIRKAERDIQNTTVNTISSSTVAQMREEIKLDVAIESAQKAYPSLVEGHEEYDQDVVDMILNAQQVYMQRDSMSASQALTTAVSKIMDKLTPATQEEKPSGLAAAKTGEDRKAAQVQKNIAAAAAQPASMKEIGVDSDKKGVTGNVDPEKLTTEEFDALPEDTKARLRGDIL